ncbi:MAG: transglycosylase SLT domain-containing protein [Verrucomicrobiae bacterium]|nr:transglycosylase SLT domain-containing protein [Verrucomicrobiae bacterium]
MPIRNLWRQPVASAIVSGVIRTRSKSVRFGRALALALALASFAMPAFVYLRWRLREFRYNRMIEEIAPRHGVDKFLVKAVMRHESGFDPFARSKSGAIGLMQVMPATARSLGVSESQLWNERTNIEIGVRLLAHALAYWRQQGADDPVPFALAEYNAGRNAVLRWLPPNRPPTAAAFLTHLPHSGVRRYVERVLQTRDEYRRAARL